MKFCSGADHKSRNSEGAVLDKLELIITYEKQKIYDVTQNYTKERTLAP